MSNKKMLVLCLLIACLSSLLTACAETIETTLTFPDTELVFQTSDEETLSVGFVNSDGSDYSKMPLDFDVRRPVWSPHKNEIYFVDPPGVEMPLEYWGHASVWRSGEEVKKCKNLNDIYHIADIVPSTSLVLIRDSAKIQLVDLPKCKKVKTLLEDENLMPEASLSPDEEWIVYSTAERNSGRFSFFINILNIETGDVLNIGNGINPTWAPDSDLIAFLSKDGIYTMNSDGSNLQKMVSYNPMWSELQYEIAPPIPQFSPDGNWIVYHKCSKLGADCESASEFSIYKFNLDTREEIKIIDGGLYPSWRD